MLAYRSSDRGRTWTGPAVAFDIDYSQHGFIPLIPRGSKRIYAFGTQPIIGYRSENGQHENTPIGFCWSDNDGRTWSPVRLIAPRDDPGFTGMSVMRMTETAAGTWLLGSHHADWSVKPLTTRQYLLRSQDRGETWTVLPGNPKGSTRWLLQSSRAGGSNRRCGAPLERLGDPGIPTQYWADSRPDLANLNGTTSDQRRETPSGCPPVSQPSLTLDVSNTKRQGANVILSFTGDTTRQIWEGIPVRRVPAELQQQARKRLSYLNAATRIEDLYIPPSNHFHAVGRRYAIRVNRQWRITFNWSDSGPSEVLLEDYH